MTHDDPRLTAYALNELDEADRAQVEAFLARDETARKFVEETRQTAGLIAQGLQTAQTPALTPLQRQSITTAAASPKLNYEPARRRMPTAWARWALATAACAALAGSGFFAFRSSMTRSSNGVAVAPPTGQWANPQLATQPALGPGSGANTLSRGRGAGGGQAGTVTLSARDPQTWNFGTNPSPQTRYLNTPSQQSQQNGQATGMASFSLEYAQLPKAPVKPNAAQFDYAKNPQATFGDANGAAAAPFAGRSVDSLDIYARSATESAPSGSKKWAGDSVLLPPANTTWAAKDAPSNPANHVAKNLPQSIEIRKNDTTYRFDDALRVARRAVARNDQDGARAALAESRKWLERESETLSPDEITQYKLALKQVEITVPGTESYAHLHENPFRSVMSEPLSTFSIDVDTASYANVRRFIDQGQLPPPDAVRIEEMINYFPYTYEKPAPDSKEPFKAAIEVAGCPWNNAHRLARIAIKGKEIAHDKRPVSNLVFLIDVSGSMNEAKKLPLVKEGLKQMVKELTENDRISIVVYAGNAGLVLPSTCADPKSRDTILAAIDNLSAGGSTNGGQGIQLAYQIATENFIKGGTNRVLLATDGDWNVGITDQSSLTHLIEDKAKSGVFLSVLGFGFGNLKDSTMEKLADKGNGHYAYIDSLKEARKVLVEQMSGTLVTIAKDVKIQVEFNPAKVKSYRLVGYENRMLKKEDFNNDKVDAGEIGAGHCVTALYELTPATKLNRDSKASAPTAPAAQPNVDALKYQSHQVIKSDDLLTLKLRYKQPDGNTSSKIEIPATDSGLSYAKASDDFKFAAAVAQFGMILRGSAEKGTASLDGVIELADEGKGKDEKGYRGEFVELVKKAKALIK
jgi:Ca-activated chloride channel family protein